MNIILYTPIRFKRDVLIEKTYYLTLETSFGYLFDLSYKVLKFSILGFGIRLSWWKK